MGQQKGSIFRPPRRGDGHGDRSQVTSADVGPTLENGVRRDLRANDGSGRRRVISARPQASFPAARTIVRTTFPEVSAAVDLPKCIYPDEPQKRCRSRPRSALRLISMSPSRVTDTVQDRREPRHHWPWRWVVPRRLWHGAARVDSAEAHAYRHLRCALVYFRSK
jgi:hypothetical protein